MSLSANSPRQKMINMMYLVLMAMLALNVSIDVLGAFWSFNNTMNINTEQTEDKNIALYAELKEKALNNPVKYDSILTLATELKVSSDSFFYAIEGFKVDMLRMAGVMDKGQKNIPREIKNIELLQSTAIAGEYFFPGGDIYRGRGERFTQMMNHYRELALSLTQDEYLHQMIDTDFSTADVRRGEVSVSWLKDKFSAYPLAAAIAFLSQYQSRIRSCQAELMSHMMSSTTENALLVTNTISAMVIPQSTTVMSGSDFKAQVILAAYDDTQTPEVFLDDGTPMPVEGGRGIISIPSGAVGMHTWGGYIRIHSDDGQTTDFPFKGTYDVTAPMAVVSPTAMNVLYRGVENPVSVSIPGISSNAVSLQGQGVRNIGAGRYVIDPISIQGKSAKYTPLARMPDGSTKSFPAQEFRIKSVPAPQGQIRGQSSLKINRNTLIQNRVEVHYPDFEFDIPLRVTGFTVKIPGRPSYYVTGDSFSGPAATAIQSAPQGSEVVIRDIKYSFIRPSKIPQKEPTPVVITLL